MSHLIIRFSTYSYPNGHAKSVYSSHTLFLITLSQCSFHRIYFRVRIKQLLNLIAICVM
jgi:hypothetical protein